MIFKIVITSLELFIVVWSLGHKLSFSWPHSRAAQKYKIVIMRIYFYSMQCKVPGWRHVYKFHIITEDRLRHASGPVHNQNTDYVTCILLKILVYQSLMWTTLKNSNYNVSLFSNNLKQMHAFIMILCSMSIIAIHVYMLKNGWKKCFDQLLGARSTQKLVEIHNNQGTFLASISNFLKICWTYDVDSGPKLKKSWGL